MIYDVKWHVCNIENKNWILADNHKVLLYYIEVWYIAFSVRSLFGEVAIHCMVRDPGPYDLLFCQLARAILKKSKVLKNCTETTLLKFACTQREAFYSVYKKYAIAVGYLTSGQFIPSSVKMLIKEVKSKIWKTNTFM